MSKNGIIYSAYSINHALKAIYFCQLQRLLSNENMVRADWNKGIETLAVHLPLSISIFFSLFPFRLLSFSLFSTNLCLLHSSQLSFIHCLQSLFLCCSLSFYTDLFSFSLLSVTFHSLSLYFPLFIATSLSFAVFLFYTFHF